MRIHTDNFPMVDVAIYAAARTMPGVYPTVTLHGSRSRLDAIELKLEGNGTYQNSGSYGANTEARAATWDEWGTIFAAIFAADSNALAGSAKRPVYDGRYDFHRKTGDRFHDGLPEDTHKRHTWEFISPREFGCRKCSAYRVYA